MPALFLETSALVKRWVAEAGSMWMRRLTGPTEREPRFVAGLLVPEIGGALTRAVRGGRISPAAHAVAVAELRADLAGRLG